MSAAVLAAKVLDMNIFNTIDGLTDDCSFSEEIEDAVLNRNIPSSFPNPEDLLILREELSNVYGSLARLPHKDINVFMMRHYDNCRISEISRKHFISPSRIETLLENTKNRVRGDLQRNGFL